MVLKIYNILTYRKEIIKKIPRTDQKIQFYNADNSPVRSDAGNDDKLF